MERVRIGASWVGFGEPCYVVAEAGSNHDGDFDQALRLIDIAAEAGANAVKFQSFKAATLYPRSAGAPAYLDSARSIYDIIHDMELPDPWIPRLARHCERKSITFLSSPFDEASADALVRFVPAFKVASYEMTHHPLLRHIARKGKPMIVSTGTARLDEVLQAVEVIRSEGNEQIILLQCTAAYPSPLETVNVRALVTLREATGLPTGLSDHSRDPIVAPMAAVASGAVLVEKHFTISNSLPGPDHKFALEPRELQEMVRRVREVERALGHGRKEVADAELELRRFARRSLFAVKPIAAGEVFSRENVSVLRCGSLGSGLPPERYEALLGRKANRAIAAETPIREEDLDSISGDDVRQTTSSSRRRDEYLLRPIREADLDMVLKWRNSERIRAVMYTDHVISRDEHRKWFETVRKGETFACLVFEHLGRPAGVVTFADIDRTNGRASWGFYLGEADLPRGTGSVMGFLGVEYAFETLGLRKLCGEAFVFNAASIKFFERLGFAREGHHVRHALKRGTYEDVLSFALFKEDWEKEKPRLSHALFSPEPPQDRLP